VINDGDVVIFGSSQSMMCAYHIAILFPKFIVLVASQKMKGNGHLQQGP